MKQVVKIFLLMIIYSTLLAQTTSNVSLEDLCRRSTAVIHGKITNIKSFWNDEKNRIYTNVTIQVITDYSNIFAAKEIMLLTYYGGSIDGFTTFVEGDPNFVNNEESLLFLRKAHQKDLLKKNYYVLNGFNGKFDIYMDEHQEKMIRRHQTDSYLFSEENRTLIPITSQVGIPFDQFEMLLNYYVNMTNN